MIREEVWLESSMSH